MPRKSQAPEFDFSSLAIEKTERPEPKNRQAAKENPFIGPLGESFENDDGRQVIVPANVVRRTLYLIRAAANELGIGARVVLLKSNGEVVEQKKASLDALRGNVTVKFAGKTRKERKSEDETTDESDESTDETTDETTDESAA